MKKIKKPWPYVEVIPFFGMIDCIVYDAKYEHAMRTAQVYSYYRTLSGGKFKTSSGVYAQSDIEIVLPRSRAARQRSRVILAPYYYYFRSINCIQTRMQ
jgi:hypothetical protein